MKGTVVSVIIAILHLVGPSTSFVIVRFQQARRLTVVLNSKQSVGTSREKNAMAPCLILIGSLLTNTVDNSLLSQKAYAYENDYASETVVNAIKSLKETIGDEVASFKSLENIGDIITEGKGVGGSVSYCR